MSTTEEPTTDRGGAAQRDRRTMLAKSIGDRAINPFGGAVEDDERVDRYLLIESSRTGDGLFLTTHPSLDTAADYHDSQEDPMDWPIEALVDLDTGERWTASTATKFGRTGS